MSRRVLSYVHRRKGFLRQIGIGGNLDTRVSTSSQDAQLQLDALVKVGVQKQDVFADVTSESRADRAAEIGC